MAVTIPLSQENDDLSGFPLAQWAWNHLELDEEDASISEASNTMSRFFVFVSLSALAVGGLGLAVLFGNLAAALTGSYRRVDATLLLALSLIALALFVAGANRSSGFLQELDDAVARAALSDESKLVGSQ